MLLGKTEESFYTLRGQNFKRSNKYMGKLVNSIELTKCMLVWPVQML